VLTFFIAGLLYLLCFEHVDNLGAYSIPSETGLLIPSGFANCIATMSLMKGTTFTSNAALGLSLMLSSVLSAQTSTLQKQVPSQSLGVEVTTNKRVYNVGEPIRFTATLRNGGSSAVYISKDFSRADGGIPGFNVSVKQLTGIPASTGCGVGADRSFTESRTPEQVLREDYLLFAPGTMVGFESEFTGCVVKNPGRYRAQATYSAQDLSVDEVRQFADKNNQVVTGQFHSEPIDFQVQKMKR
jgi:hypothetical protein